MFDSTNLHALLKTACSQTRESKTVDFKSEFDTHSEAAWCEIIKDLVAMANSGGGVIVFGVNDDGTPSEADLIDVLRLDPATIADKVRKYVGSDFDGFAVEELNRGGHRIAALVTYGSQTPLVFTKIGQYKYPNSDTNKVVFRPGGVYFRHGAKSEPGTTQDIQRSVEREIERHRRAWISGVRQVMEADPDSVIHVYPRGTVMTGNGSGPRTVRLTQDSKAAQGMLLRPDETHPLFLKHVVLRLNQMIGIEKKVSKFDIQCVRRAHDIDNNPNFLYRSPMHPTPQYSESFVDWIIAEYGRDAEFFSISRTRYQQSRSAGTKP